MIITRRNAQNVSGLKEIDLNRIITRVDSLLRDETNTFRSVDVGGFRRLKDTTIFLKRNGARQRSVVVSVNGNGRQNRTIRIEDDNMHDRSIQVFKRRERRQRQTTDFYINFGLNNYLTEDGNFPDDDGAAYGLLPLGSRYIALGINHNIMLGHSPFSLNLGLEIAWNNFMLQEDNLLRKDTGGVSFLPAQIGYDDPISVQKSKFVQTLIKAPITLRTRLAKNLTIDLGGFAGYRIDSYTKLKYERDGSTRKDHDKGNFYLSNFQYGLKAQLNFKSVGIFGEYNLNPLFTANRGPDLRVFSFGVSI